MGRVSSMVDRNGRGTYNNKKRVAYGRLLEFFSCSSMRKAIIHIKNGFKRHPLNSKGERHVPLEEKQKCWTKEC